MANNNKPSRNDRNRKAIGGLEKHYSGTATIVLDGKPTKPADAAATLQGAIDATDKTAAAETALHTAVATEKVAQADAATVRAALKTLVFNQFGPQSDAVTDFGYTKPKRKASTVETKAAAKAKAAATRKARGTTGPKAKLAIEGTVAAPATEPVAPAAAPAKPAS